MISIENPKDFLQRKNPKESAKKLPEIISEFSKANTHKKMTCIPIN